MTTSTKTTSKKPAAKKAPAKKPATRRKPVPATTATDASAPLEALVGDLPTGPRMVDLDRLVPHPRNPRTAMDEDDLQQLADSIRAQGVRQNLLVVPDPGEEGRHMIVIGHRRAIAARMAGLTEVPAVVDPTLTEAQQLELMLVENMQRSDLTVVEEADGFQGLLDLGMTRAQLAKATGVSRTKVSSRLRVATLPAEAKTKLHTGQATLEDAERLAAFADEAELHAGLLEALGTDDFGWMVINAEDTVKRIAALVPVREALEARGVSIVTESPDRGKWNFIEANPGRFSNWLEGDEAVAASDLCAWDRGGGHMWLHRRMRRSWQGAEAPAQAAEAASESAEEAAAREEREALVREAGEQMRTDLATAVQLRREFLLPLCRGEQSLKPAQVDAVMRHVVTLLLDEYWADRLVVAEWLGAYDPDDADQAQEPPTVPDLVNPTSTTPQLYLALAASVHEWRPAPLSAGTPPWSPIRRRARSFTLNDPTGWSDVDGDESGGVLAWYALLEELGYEPSAWERDRLAGVPLPGSEVLDS